MKKIGNYTVIKELGKGGMARVYLAHDARFDREVAIKVLPREFMFDDKFLARFEREARTIAKLEHPAIVPVYDYGDENGQPYLVMRHMSGGSLKERMGQGPLPTDQILKIISRVAEALHEAHEMDIIHRDLKPGNILFDRAGRAYLADFGIAKLAEATVNLTGSALVGTPAYMSPEQVHGDEIDGRSDVYALGIMLYEMLAGEKPYVAETPAKVAFMHVLEPIPDIQQVRSDLSVDIKTVMEKALAKDRDTRFSTSVELSESLTLALAGNADVAMPPPKAEPIPAPPPPTRLPEGDAPTFDQLAPPESVSEPIVQDALLIQANPDEAPTPQIIVVSNEPNPAGIEWVNIPAGEFLYGDKKETRLIEEPFLIGKYPVTNAQYKIFIDAHPGYPVPKHWDKKGRSYPQEKSDHPVVYVNWPDALRFCEWNGCRLPLEGEWEKAARGTDGLKYPWGEEIDDSFANYGGNVGDTTPVGDYLKGSSPYEALGMSGNVWEWTDSWYDEMRQRRVLRGGSWFDSSRDVRAADRFDFNPDFAGGIGGFRCATSP